MVDAHENDGQQLLNAIIANPDDDAPRLIYADWLDEQGDDERAEFIRASIELAKLRADPRRPKRLDEDFAYRAGYFTSLHIEQAVITSLISGRGEEPRSCRCEQCLQSLVGRLFHSNKCQWFDKHLAVVLLESEIFRSGIRDAVVRRGFIDEFHLTTADFMQHCHEIAAKHPVRKWVLTDFETTYVFDAYSIWDGDYFTNTPRTGEVPRPIFIRLKGGDSSSKTHRGYETEQELYADLEQACFHEARSKLTFLQNPLPATPLDTLTEVS